MAESSSILLFLDSRLVVSENIPKELRQLQAFWRRWKRKDGFFFLEYKTIPQSRRKNKDNNS